MWSCHEKKIEDFQVGFSTSFDFFFHLAIALTKVITMHNITAHFPAIGLTSVLGLTILLMGSNIISTF